MASGSSRPKDKRPILRPLRRSYPEVYFDLETTGLSHRSHITQLSAVREDRDSFNRFVRPQVPIPREVSKLTGITCKNEEMFLRGKPVESVSLKVCLNDFCDFLGDDPCILVAHNAIFDAKILFHAAKAAEAVDELKLKVAGFLDTLRLFKKEYRDLPCKYNQPALVQHFLEESYDAHNAVNDTEALMKLVRHCDFDWSTKMPHTFNVDSVEETLQYLDRE